MATESAPALMPPPLLPPSPTLSTRSSRSSFGRRRLSLSLRSTASSPSKKQRAAELASRAARLEAENVRLEESVREAHAQHETDLLALEANVRRIDHARHAGLDALAKRCADSAALQAALHEEAVVLFVRAQSRKQALVLAVCGAWVASLHHMRADLQRPASAVLACLLVLVMVMVGGALLAPERSRKTRAQLLAEFEKLVPASQLTWAASASALARGSKHLDLGAAETGSAAAAAAAAELVAGPRAKFGTAEFDAEKKAWTEALVAGLAPDEMDALGLMREAFAAATCAEIDCGIGSFRLDDSALLRFLRARQYNVDKATSMLQAHLAWRDKVVPAAILPADIEVGLRSGLVRRSGFSVDRQPITLVQVRFFNVGDYATTMHYTKLVAYFFEVTVQEADADVETGMIFFDMSGFSLWRHWNAKAMKLILAFVKMVQDHNPERLSRLVLFNTPTVFNVAWKVIKGFLDPVVRGKVHFCKDVSELRADVDPAALNVRYGGDKEDEYPIHGVDLLDADPAAANGTGAGGPGPSEQGHLHAD